MDLAELYRETILDHSRRPRLAGLREPFDTEVHQVNPVCGDEVTLRLRLGPGDGVQRTLEDVSYEAVGCSISQASTSVMSDLVIGRTVDEALGLHEQFTAMMHSRGELEPDEDVLEDAVAFLGVARFPARVKCALLGWSAFKDAAAQALGNETKEQA